MTALLLILAVAVGAMALQNRRLASQLAALAEAQAVTNERLNKLSTKTRKATCKQRAFDRKLQQQRQRQERIAKKQEQLAAEQKRQAVTIDKLQFKIAQAATDIETGKARLAQLFALLDVAEANRAASMPGSAQDVRYQRQILSLSNQIAATEKRIAKAEFDHQTAKAALAA